MSFAPSVITGPTTVTGLTNPTWTYTSDSVAPLPNSKQYAVTAIGGTQTGVTVHSIGNPFYARFTKPAIYKILANPNVSGVIKAFPKNYYELLTVKGVLPLANQPIQQFPIRTSFGLPAGADVADPVVVASAIASHAALLWQLAEELRKSVLTGIV